MKNVLFLFACLCVSILGVAQHNIGLRSGPFSGSQGILTNPTATALLPYRWDATLVGASTFFDNRFLYIENAGLSTLGSQEVLIEPADPSLRDPNTTYIKFADANNRYLNTMANIYGPSFVLKLNSFNVGFFTGVRSIVSTKNFPDNLNFQDIQTNSLGSTERFDPFDINALIYAEYGLNFSKSFDFQNGQLTVGTNLKYIQAQQAFRLSLNESFDATFIDQDTLTNNNTFSVTPTSAEAGFATADEFSINNSIGSGFGVDLGLSYTVSDISGLDFSVGAALQNIGRVNLNKEVTFYEMTTSGDVVVRGEDYAEIESLNDAVETFRQQAGSLVTTDTSNAFNMGLPTTLHLNATKRIRNNIYLSAQYSQGIPLSENSPTTGSFLSITPSFERKWFAVHVPISTYGFDDLRVGLAAKLAFLTIGTEDLGSLFRKNELYGTDFYIALKIFPFSNNNDPRGKGKGVECFEF